MNYSMITSQLYIGTTPSRSDYELLHKLGVELVINMRIGLPPRRDPISPPVVNLWLPWIDSPLFPIPILFLKIGVREALKVMRNDGVVYTHCARGRHRGPAMGACILIAQGESPDEAIKLIQQQRPVAEPQVWYIRHRIMKFAQVWRRG